MTIPSAPAFEELLSSLRLVAAKPLGGAGRRLPAVPARDETGRIGADLPLWLTYTDHASLEFDSLLSKVRKELAALGHAATDELAMFALALAFLSPVPLGGGVDRLNRLLARIKSADVSLYLWFPLKLPPAFAVEIPPFYVGPTRVDRLRYQCSKAGSDYYRRYANVLQGTSSIERGPRKVMILDVDYVQTDLHGNALKIDRNAMLPRLATVLDGYFGFLAGELFEEFIPEFVARQDIAVAMGAPFVDPESLVGLVGYQQVAIFSNFGKYGFVAPRGPGIFNLELANAHIRIPQALRELERDFRFNGDAATPAYKTVKLYASFLARAKRHSIAGRRDEAMLHAVIAMELVFAHRKALQESVSERVAVLSHEAFRRTFIEQKKWLEGVYDTRSKYVHEGRSGSTEEFLDELFQLCELLTRRMLRAAAGAGDDTAGLSSWLAHLDYVAKCYLAGRTPTVADLADAHVDHRSLDRLAEESTVKH